MPAKPQWLRVHAADTPNRTMVEELLRGLNLNTVCREANCPNYSECFSKKTATFIIAGTNCTRDCRFCDVCHGEPHPLDPSEPENIAKAVSKLGLRYVVITSVTRDDLTEGGAEHFANVIRAIRKASPETAVEALIPDFQGDVAALNIVTDASPAVISHNMETVRSLYPDVRPQAGYERSLDVIKRIRLLNPDIRSKSGIMVGLGETKEQVLTLFDDLCVAGCEFLTIGQYLAPSKAHFPVQAYIEPSQFDEYKIAAERKGFKFVASAPLVRSSYHAGEALGL